VRLSARKGFTAAVRLNVHGLSCIFANAISKLGTLIDDKTRASTFDLDTFVYVIDFTIKLFDCHQFR